VSGNWTGRTVLGQTVAGTFSVTVDDEGNVTGTFIGDYIGTIEGSVDASGNLNAVGTATIGGEIMQFIWAGTATLSENTISVQGTWTGTGASGTFTGTGTTS